MYFIQLNIYLNMKNPKFIPNTKVRVNHKYFTMRSSKILRGGPGHKRKLHLFTWKQYTCTQKAELDKYALRIGFTENIYYKDKLNHKTGSSRMGSPTGIPKCSLQNQRGVKLQIQLCLTSVIHSVTFILS